MWNVVIESIMREESKKKKMSTRTFGKNKRTRKEKHTQAKKKMKQSREHSSKISNKHMREEVGAMGEYDALHSHIEHRGRNNGKEGQEGNRLLNKGRGPTQA